MKYLLVSLFACLISFPFAATAQSESSGWNSDLEEILSADDGVSIESLKDLLAKTEDPNGQIIINYHIGAQYVSKSFYGSAIPFFKASLEGNDRHFPDALNRRDAINDNLVDALMKSGDFDAAMEYAADHVGRYDALVEDIWSKNTAAMVHRLSALQCQHELKGMIRGKTVNYSADGYDVSCGYSELSDTGSIITLYYTRSKTPEITDLRAHLSGSSAMASTVSKRHGTYVSQDAIVAVPEFETGPVMETLAQYSRGDESSYTGVWTTPVDGWILKSRVTWNAKFGTDYGRIRTGQLFHSSTQNLSDHKQTCEAEPVNKTKAQIDTAAEAGVAFVLVVTSETLKGTEFGSRPDAECRRGGGIDTGVWISSHPGNIRLYTIDGPTVNGDLYVVPQNFEGFLKSDGPVQYFLVGNYDAEGDFPRTTTVFRAYKSEPTAEQVLEDFDALASGQLSEVARIEFDENGGTNIVLSVASQEE